MSIRDNLGGGTVLDSLEEIAANTDEGKAAGALAVKELSESLGGLRFGTDGEGNYGYFGADDSLIPFKSVEFIIAEYVYRPYNGCLLITKEIQLAKGNYIIMAETKFAHGGIGDANNHAPYLSGDNYEAVPLGDRRIINKFTGTYDVRVLDVYSVKVTTDTTITINAPGISNSADIGLTLFYSIIKA